MKGFFHYITYLVYLFYVSVCVWWEVCILLSLRVHVCKAACRTYARTESISRCISYGSAVQIDACHPSAFYSILNTTGGLSCISLTVWPQHSSQCAYLTFLQVHWQSEQDNNGRPWTLCTTGQDCDGLQLRNILILIRIKAVRLAESHQP